MKKTIIFRILMGFGLLLSVVGAWMWLMQVPLSFNREPFAYERFGDLLIDVRSYAVSPSVARERFQSIIHELEEAYPPQYVDSADVQLVFPLRGKNYRSVGGRGKGFYDRNYDLFDQSVTGSHPAHDIFIYDVNRDCIEDGVGEYVDVVAVSDGLIIATEQNWTPEMDFRGGNFVWLYDFQTGGLWYYAHLRQVDVTPGQKVRAGDILGQVGRTGFNAATNRSDTHLHLMYLTIDPYDGQPYPMNYYGWLKTATTVYEAQFADNNALGLIDLAIKTLMPLAFTPIVANPTFPPVKWTIPRQYYPTFVPNYSKKEARRHH